MHKSLHWQLCLVFPLQVLKTHTATQQVPIKPANNVIQELVLWLAPIAGVLLGVYLFWRGFKLLARKRLIEDFPASKARSASLGEVEISGKAAGPYTIISPLSQTECYYYKATIGDANELSETLCVPFFVEDETGRVMVDLRGAECELPAVLQEQHYVYELGECGQHFAARHGFTSGAVVRVSECCVQAGDPLFVLGTLAENHATELVPAAQALNASMETDFLSAGAAAAQRAVMLDMMSVATPAARASGSAALMDATFDLNPPAILKKGGGSTPFVISQRSVKAIVEQLTAKSLFYIWGGPVLTLISLAVLLVKLRLW